MTSRKFLPFASGWQSVGGNLIGCPCTTDRRHHRAIDDFYRRPADEERVRRQQAAPSLLARVAHEVGDTLGVVMLIARFAVFVGALLVKHRVRRLWQRAFGREVRGNPRHPSPAPELRQSAAHHLTGRASERSGGPSPDLPRHGKGQAMTQGDRPASIRPREAGSAVTPRDSSVIARSRAMSWTRQVQINQFWNGFLFDVGQMTRDTMVFVGLAGCLIFVLLALMGGH